LGCDHPGLGDAARRQNRPRSDRRVDGGIANHEPQPHGLPEEGKAKPANEVITGFGVGLSDLVSSKASFCEPFREAIELGLSRGRNARAIWQDLVADQDFRAGYLSVRRFVRRLRGKGYGPDPRTKMFARYGIVDRADMAEALKRSEQREREQRNEKMRLGHSKHAKWQSVTPAPARN